MIWLSLFALVLAAVSLVFALRAVVLLSRLEGRVELVESFGFEQRVRQHRRRNLWRQLSMPLRGYHPTNWRCSRWRRGRRSVGFIGRGW